jgi:hypothetical protein
LDEISDGFFFRLAISVQALKARREGVEAPFVWFNGYSNAQD